MKKALITGIAGFVGSYLTEHLLEENIDVVGVVHPNHVSKNLDNIKNKITTHESDLSKKDQLKSILKTTKPDLVFHLAAFASPKKSFKNPYETLENNIKSQINLLESLVELKSNAWILVVGTAEEYGNVNEKLLPVAEDAPLAPTSPYGVSKVAQDLLGYQYFLQYGLRVIRVRPFNHIGPRQSKDFVVPAFAAQIAKIEKDGDSGTIKVGNLEAERDFTDVRDIARAYLLALSGKCTPGQVYNLGTGKPVKISDILEKLISYSTANIIVEVDKSLFREVEIKKIYCDYSRFNKVTGWRPLINLETTLTDTINYEREQIN